MIEYPFPTDPASEGYCVFPTELEDDPNILFHATSSRNFDAISNEGFKIPGESVAHGLKSVSFAKRSVGALTHAAMIRTDEPGDYVIFAVKYDSLDHRHIVINHSDIHDYQLTPSPKIIGFCVVPKTYQHR